MSYVKAFLLIMSVIINSISVYAMGETEDLNYERLVGALVASTLKFTDDMGTDHPFSQKAAPRIYFECQRIWNLSTELSNRRKIGMDFDVFSDEVSNRSLRYIGKTELDEVLDLISEAKKELERLLDPKMRVLQDEINRRECKLGRLCIAQGKIGDVLKVSYDTLQSLAKYTSPKPNASLLLVLFFRLDQSGFGIAETEREAHIAKAKERDFELLKMFAANRFTDTMLDTRTQEILVRYLKEGDNDPVIQEAFKAFCCDVASKNIMKYHKAGPHVRDNPAIQEALKIAPGFTRNLLSKLGISLNVVVRAGSSSFQPAEEAKAGGGRLTAKL